MKNKIPAEESRSKEKREERERRNHLMMIFLQEKGIGIEKMKNGLLNKARKEQFAQDIIHIIDEVDLFGREWSINYDLVTILYH